ALEVLAHLLKVVNLAVKDDPYGLVGVRHGLVAAAQVDDRKPTKPEPEWPSEVVALVIRPSVRDGLGHPLHIVWHDRSLGPEVELSADPTHGDQLVCSRSDRLRNICAGAQRCIGTSSEPRRSCLDRKEPSGLCHRSSTSRRTVNKTASSSANRPRNRAARLRHSA